MSVNELQALTQQFAEFLWSSSNKAGSGIVSTHFSAIPQAL